MPDDFLECRIGRHDFPFRAAKREFVREWRRGRVRDTINAVEHCRRCGGTRYSARDRYEGHLVAMWYDMPEGYHNPVEGEGQIPARVAYLEMVRRYPPDGE
jgi:hypothetical protein